MKTAYDLVWIASERTPDHLALVDDRTDRKLTYRQLLAEVDVVAAGFAARGIKAGSRVATILPNVFEHCVALLALQRLAAVPALMNARLQPAELAKLVVQGEIEGAIIRKDEALVQAIAAALPAASMLLSVDGAIGKAEDFAACRGERGKIAGNTSARSGSHRLYFLHVRYDWAAERRRHHAPHGRASHCVDIDAGRASPRHPQSDARHGADQPRHRLLRHSPGHARLQRHVLHDVRVQPGSGKRSHRTAQDHLSCFRCQRSIKQLSRPPATSPKKWRRSISFFTAARLSRRQLLDRIDREWPATVRHIYGTTEIMCALHNPEPVGRPVTLRPGYYSRVRIVRHGGNESDVVKPGEAGELIVDASADTFFSGYLNRPDATAEKLRNGWYFTGDVCVLRDDGDVDLVGRVDDVIRSGGESVYPEEVEAVLATHPAIREAAVIGVPDPLWGEMVVACVALAAAIRAGRSLTPIVERARLRATRSLAPILRWQPASQRCQQSITAGPTRSGQHGTCSRKSRSFPLGGR